MKFNILSLEEKIVLSAVTATPGLTIDLDPNIHTLTIDLERYGAKGTGFYDLMAYSNGGGPSGIATATNDPSHPLSLTYTLNDSSVTQATISYVVADSTDQTFAHSTLNIKVADGNSDSYTMTQNTSALVTKGTGAAGDPSLLTNDNQNDPTSTHKILGPSGTLGPNGVDTITSTNGKLVKIHGDGSFEYDASAAGTDSFIYGEWITKSDGSTSNRLVTVYLTVQADSPPPPSNSNDSYTFAQANSYSSGMQSVLDNDGSGATLDLIGWSTDAAGNKYRILISDKNVKIYMNTDGKFIYGYNSTTPLPIGTDTFTYNGLNGGDGSPATHTVTVTITDPNDSYSFIQANSYSSGTQSVLDNDGSGAKLNYTSWLSDAAGKYQLLKSTTDRVSIRLNENGTFTYGYNSTSLLNSGIDTFKYTVKNADGSTATRTVTLNIAPDPNDSYSFMADTRTAFYSNIGGASVLADDGNGAQLDAKWMTDRSGNKFAILESAKKVPVTITEAGYFFYKNNGVTGTDTFSYNIIKGDGSKATYTVTLTIADSNDSYAVVQANSYSSGMQSVLANDGSGATFDTTNWLTDANNNKYQILTSDLNKVKIYMNANGNFVYGHNSQTLLKLGTDTFSYTVKDIYGRLATHTVTLTITDANDSYSVVQANSYSSGMRSVLTNDGSGAHFDTSGSNWKTDAAGKYQILKSNNGTSIRMNEDGKFTYGYGSTTLLKLGTDTFNYTIVDGIGNPVVHKVTLIVQGTPASTNHNDSYTFTYNTGKSYGTTTSVLVNDEGAAFDSNTLAWKTDAAGKFQILKSNKDISIRMNEDGTFIYGYGSTTLLKSGMDTFNYTVKNANGTTSTHTVTVNVQALSSSDSYSFKQESDNTYSSGTASLLDNDNGATLVPATGSSWSTDINDNKFLSIISTHGKQVWVNESGQFIYRSDVAGTDSFNYTVKNADGTTYSTYTVTVKIQAPDPNDYYKITLGLGTSSNISSPNSVLDNDGSGVQLTAITWYADVNNQRYQILESTKQHVQVRLNEDGTFIYGYGPNTTLSAGTDTFSYTGVDAQGKPFTRTVTLILDNGNVEGMAVATALSTNTIMGMNGLTTTLGHTGYGLDFLNPGSTSISTNGDNPLYLSPNDMAETLYL